MTRYLLLLVTMMTVAKGWAQSGTNGLVLVEGGPFTNTKSTNYYGKAVTLADFYIGRLEVTQKEWAEVMGDNPAQFKGDDLPVDTVDWYDCVAYCNKRSMKEGLVPYYEINKDKKDPNNKNALDNVKWTVTVKVTANGYRLPTEAEWEYAAGGGRLSRSYTYSGGEALDKVAWFWMNSGDSKLEGHWSWPKMEQNKCRTRSAGRKAPNELGLYDMSGNVREWCWDWGGSNGGSRVWKGGGWIGSDFCCEPSFRAEYEANGKGPDQGLRVCRNK